MRIRKACPENPRFFRTGSFNNKKKKVKGDASMEEDRSKATDSGNGVSSYLGTIRTPKGEFRPQTDDLVEEIRAAAVFSSLSHFRLFLNDVQIMKVEDLPCTKISELPKVLGMEQPQIRLDPYDRAG